MMGKYMDKELDIIKKQYSELHYYMYHFPKEFSAKLAEAIDNRFPIDYVDDRGRTLLSRSIRYTCHNTKNTTYISLLNYGADPNIPDDTGRQALALALGCYMRQTKYRIIVNLINAGADANATDRHGNSPLHLVIYHDHSYSILRCLLEAGANVNAIDKDGYTVFSELARDYIYGSEYRRKNSLKAIRLLLKYNADPYLCTKWLETKNDVDEDTLVRKEWIKLLCDTYHAKSTKQLAK